MRFIFKLIFGLLLLTPVAVGGLIVSALSTTPLVPVSTGLSSEDLARARAFIDRNDPRRLPAGASRQLVAEERDLTLAANYLLQQLFDGGAEIDVRDGVADARLSAAVPKLPGVQQRRYLNLSLQFAVDAGTPRLRALRLGGYQLPATPVDFTVRELLLPLFAREAMRIATRVIEDVALRDQRLQMTVRWHPELLDEIRSQVFSSADRAAIEAYHRRLVELSRRRDSHGSLMKLLGPMFSLAELRSEGSDPVAENRALLLVLGSWATGRGTGALLPATEGRTGVFRLRLHRRQDLAQHFLSSAAMAAGGDARLSDAVGLFKEMRDAGAGSGFSFTDIAADRAGTRFGQLATENVASARRVQRQLASGLPEDAIMPAVGDLPEHLAEDEFKRRFVAVGSPAYRAVMQDIESRIETSHVYRR